MAPEPVAYPNTTATPIGAAPGPPPAVGAAPGASGSTPAAYPTAYPPTSAAPPPAGFDGVQKPQLGPYPPAEGKPVMGPSGYPTVAPVAQQLPAGYPGATAVPPPGYRPAGAPPVGGAAMMGAMPPGAVAADGDKIGPLGITAWVLFVAGILFPIAWIVCCFLPLCARKGAKGPKDALAVRRAAIASSIALCLYMVLLVVLASVGATSWKPHRNICRDRFGATYYC